MYGLSPQQVPQSVNGLFHWHRPQCYCLLIWHDLNVETDDSLSLDWKGQSHRYDFEPLQELR
jgi:hypothetical protein